MNKFDSKLHLFGAAMVSTLFLPHFPLRILNHTTNNRAGGYKVFIILVFTSALILLFVNFHKILFNNLKDAGYIYFFGVYHRICRLVR